VEIATVAVTTATLAQKSQGAGKAKTTEAATKTDETGKDGDKQVIDSAKVAAPANQAAESAQVQKATSDTSTDSEKPAADKAETKQDTTTTSADGADSSKTSKTSHTSAAENHPSIPAPAVQPLQPDPSVLLANNQPQPLQLNVPNVVAMPAPQLTATVLAGNAPVPLDGLAADIALRAAGGNSRFEIRLDPAELGRIDVRLDVDKHGQVTSHLTVERPATLDMLRRDAPQLQQALEDAGLKTGDSGLQFSLRDQSSSGQQNDDGSGRQSQRLVIADENAVPVQAAGRNYGRMLGSSGGVDIRV
jgi:chemotaxis protein MotD